MFRKKTARIDLRSVAPDKRAGPEVIEQILMESGYKPDRVYMKGCTAVCEFPMSLTSSVIASIGAYVRDSLEQEYY